MSWIELVGAAEAIQAAAEARGDAVQGATLVGIGWATVEAERAIGELDRLLAEPGGSVGDTHHLWRPTPRDEWLGATAWRRPPGRSNDPSLVVLEPDTEGPLAAALVRFGEGVAAIYLRPRVPGHGPAGEARDGPLGRGRLLRGGPAWGPHVVVLETGRA